MHISQAPTGINFVIETERAVYIGRMGKTTGDQVSLHHAMAFPVNATDNTEDVIRKTARYGIPVQHEEIQLASQGILRIRKLGDVPKA